MSACKNLSKATGNVNINVLNALMSRYKVTPDSLACRF